MPGQVFGINILSEHRDITVESPLYDECGNLIAQFFLVRFGTELH